MVYGEDDHMIDPELALTPFTMRLRLTYFYHCNIKSASRYHWAFFFSWSFVGFIRMTFLYLVATALSSYTPRDRVVSSFHGLLWVSLG